MKHSQFIAIVCVLLIFIGGCREKEEILSLFPLKKYDQQLSNWIKPTDNNYNQPVLSREIQQQHMMHFMKHYVGESSPWDEKYIHSILNNSGPDNIQSIEQDIISTYSNKHQTNLGYGENFRPYDQRWIDAIAANIHVTQLANLQYDPAQRAIAIDNLLVRSLPTDDGFFYSYKIAGEGYPFDQLQISATWAGTPLYILGETQDHAWSLITTPEFIGWAKSTGIARVTPAFIQTWTTAAKKQLAAITQTQTSIVDTQGVFRFSAYVGSVFPAVNQGKQLTLLVPMADATRHAIWTQAVVSDTQATLMPLSPTPHHFSDIIRTLIGRPYGWGNLYFYNDCSSELKSVFTPFGIWLARNSSEQIRGGNDVDLSSQSTSYRLKYLMLNGRALTTLVYVGGHIILFIGNFPNPNASDHAIMPLTYQNMWGLSPNPPSRRAVVGQSVLFPLLEHYPEDPRLVSQASKKTFHVVRLDETPNDLMRLQVIDLKALMNS